MRYRIGVCGLGFVGNAIYQFFNQRNPEICAYDKYKYAATLNNTDNSLLALLDSDILFICLPTPYSTALKAYDLSEIESTLAVLNAAAYTGVILLKSTIQPEDCSKFNNTYAQLYLVHNPEFLSFRTATTDFEKQKQIVLGFTEQSSCKIKYITDFYEHFFPEAKVSVTNSTCAALMKLSCNSFYAVKIQFFTELYLLCEHLHVSFEEVKTLMLQNDWIHPQHTTVPGIDGSISFGGACFPKDLAALNAFIESLALPHATLEAALKERNDMRKD
jgi:UDPglucose 6-dehydrogenase